MTALAKLKESNDESKQWRQAIHANPETAFEEVDTSDYVAEKLKSWGVEIHRGMAKTAVVGIIKGKKNTSGEAIGLRADMDALDLLEKTGVSYCSKNEGKMHACGHDGHTAMLLAATKYLSETRDFNGTVYVIFQPAEEGSGGARVMIEDGFFEKFPCKSIFGMHNWPWLPAGTIAIAQGPVTAAADRFIVKIKGKGGHAAFPHGNIDVVTTASSIVTSLQTLVSRNTDPADSAVISICKFHAGTESLNVMAESAEIGGTVRSFKPETRKMLEEGIKRIVKLGAESFGATAEVDWQPGYPSTINSVDESEICREVAKEIIGEDKVLKFTPTMGAEDFSYFLEKCPGTYVALGQAEKENKHNSEALHSPNYDFNDNVLPIGAAYWVGLAEKLLPLD